MPKEKSSYDIQTISNLQIESARFQRNKTNKQQTHSPDYSHCYKVLPTLNRMTTSIHNECDQIEN